MSTYFSSVPYLAQGSSVGISDKNKATIRRVGGVCFLVPYLARASSVGICFLAPYLSRASSVGRFRVACRFTSEFAAATTTTAAAATVAAAAATAAATAATAPAVPLARELGLVFLTPILYSFPSSSSAAAAAAASTASSSPLLRRGGRQQAPRRGVFSRN